MLDQQSILRSQGEFMSSCKLMELDVNGNTKNDKAWIREITAQDGLVYTESWLSLRIEFRPGFFTKMEQRNEYSGWWRSYTSLMTSKGTNNFNSADS